MEESKLLPMPYNYWKWHTSMESYFARGVLTIFVRFRTGQDLELFRQKIALTYPLDQIQPEELPLLLTWLSYQDMVDGLIDIDLVENGYILKVAEDQIFGRETKYHITFMRYLEDFIDRLTETDPAKILENKVKMQYIVNPVSIINYNKFSPIVTYVIFTILDFVERKFSDRIDYWIAKTKRNALSIKIVSMIEVNASEHDVFLNRRQAYILYIMNKNICDSLIRQSLTLRDFDWYEFCISRFIMKRI